MTLYKGDCLEVMKSIPDGSVDAIITDPPYGTTACKWDAVIDFELMWEQLNRIIKPNAAKYCPLSRTENISVFGEFGVNSGAKKIGTYNPQGVIEINKKKKDSGYGERKMGAAHLSTLVKGTEYVQKFTNYPQRLQKFNRDKNAAHPTQKPVALMEYLIKTYTKELETVLDFTMGSGTTGVACCNLNRDFIGIELDKQYFKIAQDRIKNEL